ncbi:ABC-2 type transport system ATP-binding protein [Clostridium amylolyticum]|uniref:ABC-2 type transport system ATP-binding protein n=1 Tax=Clostridium amylolyticum TaxID=1121298 RepID=A0A1M6B4Z6_9CLOT|nr:ABC transporter ATP-binding protein [Clostridium amylolyticum]SHI43730.1 ABC-2 type transport system ATP-binding protein [Clostridium amylolyticum]
MKILEVNNLTKRFGDKIAVDNLSFYVNEGEIFGLLGPNGAGKSTTINIIISLLKSSKGEINIFGKSLHKNELDIKKNIGVVPQSLAIYENLTAEENIRFFAGLYGLSGKNLKEAVDYALDFTGLTEVRKTRAKKFSGGMMRRLNIACAIAHKPKFIIMDEPTVGIDPQSRNHILRSVKLLQQEGCTILYTSHYMEEVEVLCNRIVIMDHGKIIAEGSKDELISLVSDSQNLEIQIDNMENIDMEKLKSITGVKSISVKEDNITINSSREINNLDKIIGFFTSQGVKIKNIDYKNINLEMVFLNLTGRNLRD